MASVAVATALTSAASESGTGRVTTMLTVPGRGVPSVPSAGAAAQPRTPSPQVAVAVTLVGRDRVRGHVGGRHQPGAGAGEAFGGGDLGEVPVGVQTRIAAGHLGVEYPVARADAAAEHGAAADPPPRPEPPHQVVQFRTVLLPGQQFTALFGQ